MRCAKEQVFCSRKRKSTQKRDLDKEGENARKSGVCTVVVLFYIKRVTIWKCASLEMKVLFIVFPFRVSVVFHKGNS